MTPQEIADDVYACWKAGAAVAHLHMRDDEGNGTMDTAKFEETVTAAVIITLFFNALLSIFNFLP